MTNMHSACNTSNTASHILQHMLNTHKAFSASQSSENLSLHVCCIKSVIILSYFDLIKLKITQKLKILNVLKHIYMVPHGAVTYTEMNHTFSNEFQSDTNRFCRWVGIACSSLAHPGINPVRISGQNCKKTEPLFTNEWLVSIYTKDHITSTIVLLYEILMMLNRIHFCFFVVVISAQWGLERLVLLRWFSFIFVFYLVIHHVTSEIYGMCHLMASIARFGHLKCHVAKIMGHLNSKVSACNFLSKRFCWQLPGPQHYTTHTFITTHKELSGDHQQRFSVLMSCKFHHIFFLLFACLFPSNGSLYCWTQQCCTEVLWLNCTALAKKKRARWPDSSIDARLWRNGQRMRLFQFIFVFLKCFIIF